MDGQKDEHPLLRHFPEEDRRDLDRIIVIRPNSGESYFERLFAAAGLTIPAVLDVWQDTVDGWLDSYSASFAHHRLLEIFLETSVFWYDRDATHDRVVVAYGLSAPIVGPRDAGRMRRFPDANNSARSVMPDVAAKYDRGHFLSHASGGPMDINLFPQLTELNRGWSDAGRRFRSMERAVVSRPGTFHYHRAEYSDDSWIPDTLEYGVLREDSTWWIDQFRNR